MTRLIPVKKYKSCYIQLEVTQTQLSEVRSIASKWGFKDVIIIILFIIFTVKTPSYVLSFCEIIYLSKIPIHFNHFMA